jgi:hypothetical protein
VNYDDLIFGSYSIDVVLEAVNDVEWQTLRISLKGLPTEEKLSRLRKYIGEDASHEAKVRVTNYVYALKRGGQLR